MNDAISRLIDEGRLEEAIMILSHSIWHLEDKTPVDKELLAEYYFMRGKAYWKFGRRSFATSDFAKASYLNPASPATKALEQARDIEAFFNPDLYNP